MKTKAPKKIARPTNLAVKARKAKGVKGGYLQYKLKDISVSGS